MTRLSLLLFIPLFAALAGCGHAVLEPVIAGENAADAGRAAAGSGLAPSAGSDAGSASDAGSTSTSVQGSVGGTTLDAKEAFYFYMAPYSSGDVAILTFGVSDRLGTCALMKQGQMPANAVVAFVQIPRDSDGPLPVGDYPYAPTLVDSGTLPNSFDFGGFQALDGSCKIIQQVEASGGDLNVLNFTAGASSDATLNLTFPNGNDHLGGSLHAKYCDLPQTVSLSGCGQ